MTRAELIAVLRGEKRPRSCYVLGMLTHARARELLTYDMVTGLFRWAKTTGNRVVGTIAGTTHANGYVFVTIARKHYSAGRLAWFWMTGAWPAGEVDHIDSNPANNRWENLRLATSAENKWNTRVSKNNRAGLKGAFWHGQMGKWRSQIMKDRKLYNLGMFDTAEQAHAAYVAKASELFGEFARA